MKTEERIDNLDEKIKEVTRIVNDVVAYVNTLERWRKLTFQTKEDVDATKEETNNPESPEGDTEGNEEYKPENIQTSAARTGE